MVILQLYSSPYAEVAWYVSVCSEKHKKFGSIPSPRHRSSGSGASPTLDRQVELPLAPHGQRRTRPGGDPSLARSCHVRWLASCATRLSQAPAAPLHPFWSPRPSGPLAGRQAGGLTPLIGGRALLPGPTCHKKTKRIHHLPRVLPCYQGLEPRL